MTSRTSTQFATPKDPHLQSNITMDTTAFSPKAFLKRRRPERFSDSRIEETTPLDRTLLEYHLSSLTSRGQESDFENFAHKLCEREICPNLLPQTGPTGGGDSKVDSETYPVAGDLALGWYVGLNREAASERWAFAFSAKADWNAKVKSDVAKIAKTKRGYTKAFFVTSQAVPDRKRAEIEDSLRTKHGLDVRILDRTWILDRVFEGKHQDLAIEELHLTALKTSVSHMGPNDSERAKQLDALEKRIQERLQKGPDSTVLVDDALAAADLARNLERSPAEIEGRYYRAEQLALKVGTDRQKVEVAYQWAWTLYYWFEDYHAFLEKYQVVEERVVGSRNAFDLERLFTLWFSLYSAVQNEVIDKTTSAYEAHRSVLIRELERLALEKDRPSTALQAETMLLQLRLMQQLTNEEALDDVLVAIKSVIERSIGLVGYSLEPLVQMLTELSHLLELHQTYNTLFDTVVDVASTREGEIKAAQLLLNRGEQQLLHNRPVEAIATLGKALGRLSTNETRYELVRALYLCGCAYDQLGLLWAARATLTTAASIATDELWRYGTITPQQATIYRRIKWVELQIGRLPSILAWHELDMVSRHALIEQGYNPDKLRVQEPEFESLLGRLLLRTDFSDLKALTTLPDVLDHVGLPLASDALLYALGHEERLAEVAVELGNAPEEFARKWWAIESDAPLPTKPDLSNKRKIQLEARIAGCVIKITSDAEKPCPEVAESLLAIVESFMSTSIVDRAIALEPELTIEVQLSHFAKVPVSFSCEQKGGRPHIVIRCRAFDPYTLSVETHAAVRHALFEIAMTLLGQVIVFKDTERDLATLFSEERVSERAVTFTNIFTAQSNVLGNAPKTRLTSWTTGSNKHYSLLRNAPLQLQTSATSNDATVAVETGQTQATLPDPQTDVVRADQYSVLSLIRQGLWERAGWDGTVFMTDPSHKYLPVFALVFQDRSSGREIFAQWRSELGKADQRNQLRLSVIKGIDEQQIHAYSVVVGVNIEALPVKTRFATLVGRVHTMEARTPDNLNRFLSAYEAMSAFLFAPAYAPKGFRNGAAPEVDLDHGIVLQQINVRHAWEIGPNDLEAVAIHEEDVPVIPPDVQNPPVHDLINVLRSRRSRQA